uniref:Uncharacterized protein n=1 Tax=viral metagenome TaxID=1070528 RepID=A0A6M3KA07_9ZZZZ
MAIKREDRQRDITPWDSLELSLMRADIVDRESRYPPAPLCVSCKRECKVHPPPDVYFNCEVVEVK